MFHFDDMRTPPARAQLRSLAVWRWLLRSTAKRLGPQLESRDCLYRASHRSGSGRYVYRNVTVTF